MHICKITLLPFALLLLSACGGSDSAPAKATDSAAAKGTGSERSDQISCKEFFNEFRDGVLGHLRGTEQLGLIAHVTAVSASTYGSGTEPTMVPESSCGIFGRSLRKARKPGSFTAAQLAPACAALVERIDQDCLKPLVGGGIALGKTCNMTLIGLSGSREDIGRIMADDSQCRDR